MSKGPSSSGRNTGPVTSDSEFCKLHSGMRGERNTLVGCTLYNSRLAVRLAQSSAALHLQGCSLDYTGRLYDVAGGFVLATSCHHESSVWEDRAIRCAGDGSLIRLDGGVILNQAGRWNAHSLIDVGRGSTVGTGVHVGVGSRLEPGTSA